MSEESKNTGRAKVLVIDDEQDLREAVTTVLSADGHEVLTAADGVEGLTLALNEHPDLILLDLQMPNMRGEEVLKKLRTDEWGSRALVLVLTALNDMDSVSRTFDAGGMDFIVKSDVRLKDISRKVHEMLAR